MSHSTLEYYRQNALEVAQRYESADVTQLHTFLAASFKSGGNLLEIGCGSGRDAAHMIKHGFRVIAIDGSKFMLEQAVHHHPELAGRVANLKLPDGLISDLGVFDGIYAIAVLMHLSRQEIKNTISVIHSLLVSKGRFVFSVPTQRDDIQNNEFDSKGRRFTAFSPKGWEKLCSEHDLRILRTMTTKDGLGRGGVVWMSCLTEKS